VTPEAGVRLLVTPAAREPTETAEVASVYVHAPFCARRCVYCDFAVQVRRRGDPREWLDAIGGELRALRAEGRVRLAERLDTLYVGGGTPSLLGVSAMDGLRKVVGPDRVREGPLEWTAEANPESFTDEVAEGWRAAGVNRISLGVQSFHERSLRWMGRLHGAAGAEEAVRRARRAGFREISVDLIFGLPSRLDRSWRDDLDRAASLDVTHVSLYGLTVEEGTALGRAVREGREEPVDDERYASEYLEASERLRALGYRHYEVSNFARPGSEARHNRVYWNGEPYLGLGNAAHSYHPPVRRWNLRDWDAYRERASAGALPLADREVVDADAARLERCWLGLRTTRGIALDGLPDGARSLALEWCTHDLATLRNGAVRLTADGWLLLDRLVLDLDRALDASDTNTTAAAHDDRHG